MRALVLPRGIIFIKIYGPREKYFRNVLRGMSILDPESTGSSRMYSAFMPVTIVDIRPLISKVQGLTILQDDATSLSMLADNSVSSLSSLHATEHFGLGRYSDPIDPDACFKFMDSLQRVLAADGKLYFSVPVGKKGLNSTRIAYSAHGQFWQDSRG